MNKSLSSSVGHRAQNLFDDVRLVQYLLNCVPVNRGGPTRELVVDGVCGRWTVRAIIRFQRAQRGATAARIDPHQHILRALLTHDPYPAQSLPAACAAS